MRVLMLLLAVTLCPFVCEAGSYGSSRYSGNRYPSSSYSRYSSSRTQAHNRTDYAQGVNRYSRNSYGYGYTNLNRYGSIFSWGARRSRYSR